MPSKRGAIVADGNNGNRERGPAFIVGFDQNIGFCANHKIGWTMGHLQVAQGELFAGFVIYIY